MANVLKLRTYLVHFLNKTNLLSWLEYTKCNYQTSQKLFDLGLPCLHMPFWQATSVRNVKTFTVILAYLLSLCSLSVAYPILTSSLVLLFHY